MIEPQSPILYILMRTDLDSMNPGKAMAQASHATSMFHKSMHEDHPLNSLFEQWSNEADGFGTCIVLDGGNGFQVEENIVKYAGMIEALGGTSDYGICIDPTYPIKDGEHTWLVDTVTCGFIFTTSGAAEQVGLKKLSLHR